MTDPKKNSEKTKEKAKPALAECSCVSDPFAQLPPEARPRPKPNKGKLRQVTCPGCGLKYWTNRSTDVCIDCEKKGSNINQKTGGN
jgi:hypothetical protein